MPGINIAAGDTTGVEVEMAADATQEQVDAVRTCLERESRPGTLVEKTVTGIPGGRR